MTHLFYFVLLKLKLNGNCDRHFIIFLKKNFLKKTQKTLLTYFMKKDERIVDVVFYLVSVLIKLEIKD